MGNAGTAMRLFMGLLCGQNFSSTLIGDVSLMGVHERVAKPLRQMGARIDAGGSTAGGAAGGAASCDRLRCPWPVPRSSLQSCRRAGVGITQITEPATTRDHTELMLGVGTTVATGPHGGVDG
jgi:3-phosphoshikimate 1-carboxyvinyltransferase